MAEVLPSHSFLLRGLPAPLGGDPARFAQEENKPMTFFHRDAVSHRRRALRFAGAVGAATLLSTVARVQITFRGIIND